METAPIASSVQFSATHMGRDMASKKHTAKKTEIISLPKPFLEESQLLLVIGDGGWLHRYRHRSALQ